MRRAAAASPPMRSAVARLDLQPRAHGKRLPVAAVVAGGLEAQRLEALLDVRARRREPRACRRRAPRAPDRRASGCRRACDRRGGSRGQQPCGRARAQSATNTFVSCCARRRRAVRRERQPLAVGREQREAVEPGRRRDPLEPRAGDVHRPQVELAPARIAVFDEKIDARLRRPRHERRPNDAASRYVT